MNRQSSKYKEVLPVIYDFVKNKRTQSSGCVLIVEECICYLGCHSMAGVTFKEATPVILLHILAKTTEFSWT